MNIPTPDPHVIGTSASNAAADRLCPGRFLASRNLKDTRTEWSEHGDKIHAALAESGNVTLVQSLTPDQRDMFDAHREIEKKVITSIWNGEPEKSTRVWKEQRYWGKVPEHGLAWPGPQEFYIHSGQADFVMRRKNIALVQDYKSLSGDVVESLRNHQLRDLAVLAWRNLDGVDGVYVCINQPLDTWTPELCRYTKPELEQAEQEMWDRVRKSNDPNSPRIPGELQCKYCRALTICPEASRWLEEFTANTIASRLVTLSVLSPPAIANLLDKCALAEMMIEQIRQHSKQLLENNPDAVPGWFLKPGAIKESVNNPQELFNRFSTLGGDLNQFMACVKITKKELEAGVRTVTGIKGKALKVRMETLLEGIVDAKQNSPSLARKEEVVL